MKIDFNEEMSNYDLMDIANNYDLPLNDVITKDKIPKKLLEGFYIINLDDSTGQGTHWVVLCKRGKEICYFDSYGAPPSQMLFETIKKGHKHAWYSDLIIQDYNSVMCGYYCLVFMAYMNEREGSFKDIFKSFHDLFKDNSVSTDNKIGKQNDKLARKLFNHYF